MIRGVDYSWARPGGAAIRAAGFEFVVRYVPYPGDGGKGLTASELADLRANGLAVALVYESTAARHLDGYGAGVFDAARCENAVMALGFPPDFPIYFAVDFDAQPSQFAAIDAYQRGAASLLGLDRVGVYGSYRVVKHCADVDSARWYWQALAWSGGQHFPERHIYQSQNGRFVNGGEVDWNEAYFDDFGQWKPEEEDMADQELRRAMLSGGEERTLTDAEREANIAFRLGQYGNNQESLASYVGSLAAAVTKAVEAINAATGPELDLSAVAAELAEIKGKLEAAGQALGG